MSTILDDRYLAGGRLGALGTGYGEVIVIVALEADEAMGKLLLYD